MILQLPMVYYDRFMIVTHPEVERRVVSELDALGLLATPARPEPRQLEYEDVSKLMYLTNCIKACLCSMGRDLPLCMHVSQARIRTKRHDSSSGHNTTCYSVKPCVRPPGIAADAATGQWDHAHAGARPAAGSLHASRRHTHQHQPGRHGQQRAQLHNPRALPASLPYIQALVLVALHHLELTQFAVSRRVAKADCRQRFDDVWSVLWRAQRVSCYCVSNMGATCKK